MKLKLSVLFILFFLSTQALLACVFDTSNTTLYINENKVIGSSSFHPFQIDYLLRQNNRSVSRAENFMQESEFIESYVSSNLRFYNAGMLCEIHNISLLVVDAVNIFFEGVEISYVFECDEIIEESKVVVDFFSEIGRQTNMLRIIYGDDPKFQIYESLDPEYPELSFNVLIHEYIFDGSFLDNQSAQIVLDEDIYSQAIDIDDDNFCNILDFDTLGYTHMGDMSMCDTLEEISLQSGASSSLMDINQGNNFIINLYSKVQKKLQIALIDGKVGIMGLSFIIFMLGFLHAAGPGHSKSVLIALMIDNNSSFQSGLKYIISYTLTHYIDIIFFSMIISLFLYTFDITQYHSVIQVFSAIILLCLSVFLVYRSLKSFGHTKGCSCCKNNNVNNRYPVLVGFFSGIVPCMLAWTLFFLLTSLGLIHYIIFMILALMGGTFIFLLLLLIFINRLRSYGFLRFQKYLRYTPLVSAGLLFIISLSIFSTLL